MKRLNLWSETGFIKGICVLALFIMASPISGKNMFTRLYVRQSYQRCQPEKLLKDIDSVRSWGLNGILFDSGDLGSDRMLTDDCVNNLKAAVAKARHVGVALIPMYPGQKHPSMINPDWGEVLHTRGTRYQIVGSEARIVATPVTLTNVHFDAGMVGWTGTNGKAVHDAVQGRSSPGSLRFDGPTSGNTAVQQTIKLKKHTSYLVSAYIKTQNVITPDGVGFSIKGNKRMLRNLRYAKGVRQTQNWRLHQESFNSVDCETATIKLMASSSRKTSTGTVWFDDVKVREVGLYEVVRRSNTPIVVRSEAGASYQEGKDYVVEAASPVAANSQGTLTIPSGSAIGDGETILVDWYKWATVTLVPPEGSYVLEDVYTGLSNRVDKIDALLAQPRCWFVKHSEWKLGCWDPTCQATFKNAGEYFAYTFTRCRQILQKSNSNREILMYSDETDPYHRDQNVHNWKWRSAAGAWAGLTDSMIILNWNAGKEADSKKNSLLFYAGMDTAFPEKKTRQRVILGTDAFKLPDGSFNWWGDWLNALKKAEAAGLPDGSVIGICHDNYSVGVFGAAEIMAKTCQAQGRWDGVFRRHDELTPTPEIRKQDQKMKYAAATLSVTNSNNHAPDISYRIPHDGNVHLRIVNVAGQVIKVLRNQHQSAGTHTLSWDFPKLSGGVVFVQLVFDDGAQRITQKLVTF